MVLWKQAVTLKEVASSAMDPGADVSDAWTTSAGRARTTTADADVNAPMARSGEEKDIGIRISKLRKGNGGRGKT